MLHDALDAFVRLDVPRAASVIVQHRTVCVEFRSVTHILTTFMAEDPDLIPSALNTMWVAKAIQTTTSRSLGLKPFVDTFVWFKNSNIQTA